MGILMQPGAAAGFWSLFGRLEKSAAGDLLNTPEGMLNLGGNGNGFLLDSKTDWDPTANEDGTVTGLALGDDVYLYLVSSGLGDGRADIIASQNATTPDGYDSTTSRKIGGFHYGLFRPESERYNKTFVPGTQIVPNSCWDLGHRPASDPSGMVEFIPDAWWVSIYMLSEGSGTWPSTVPLSRYGATPLSGAEGYSRLLDYPVLLANAGMQLPSLEMFYIYAEGAPEGNDGDNDTAWSSTSNTDRTSTGSVTKAVSCKGVVDPAGLLWEPTLNVYDETGTYNWERTILENGKDSAELRGEMRHVRWRFWLAGGDWDSGVRVGSRCGNSNDSPGNVNSHTGLRGVSPARRQ